MSRHQCTEYYGQRSELVFWAPNFNPYEGSADRTFSTDKYQTIVLGGIEQLGEFRFTPVIWNIFVRAAKGFSWKICALLPAMTKLWISQICRDRLSLVCCLKIQMQYGLYSKLMIILLKWRFIETQLNNSYSIAQGLRQLPRSWWAAGNQGPLITGLEFPWI